MYDPSKVLQNARVGADLSIDHMAVLLGVEESMLEKFESGEERPQHALLAQAAQVLGLEISELHKGQTTASVPAVLFRSLPNQGRTLEELAITDSQLVFGEFIRTVRRILRLRKTMDRARNLDVLGELQTQAQGLAESSPHEEGAQLAEWVRKKFKLGVAPVSSIKSILEELGIIVLFAAPDGLTPSIDGMSTIEPWPAVLVNVIEGQTSWWRARMTMAHELCHILLDLSAGGLANNPPTLLSPHAKPLRQPTAWTLIADYPRVERRANAFAAHLLAPDAGVRAVVGSSPTSPDNVATVARKYGLGLTTAVNRVCDIYKLNGVLRDQLISAMGMEAWSGESTREELGPFGLSSGELRELVSEALASGRISATEARVLLGLGVEQWLPESGHLTQTQRRPIFTSEELVRRRVDRHLRSCHGQDYCADAVTAQESGWSVAVVRYETDDTPIAAGTISTDFNLEVTSCPLKNCCALQTPH